MKPTQPHHSQDFKQSDIPAEAKARLYVHRLRRFYQSLIGYTLVVIIAFAVNYLAYPGFWWAWWSALGMGIALAFKAAQLLELKLFWNSDWEDKKVADLLKKTGK